ncbi:inverse autotransporter beta domain-containing protein [Legionella maioricensis]|uniref:Inverse autotransporter beta domain-containing protein n=1 Tax=Legionella maioricensis TaxID=2896528 RepID=A0A9X2IAJ9_9GAMM|nr:inverse autotransporter beta domain-containing protein [Legionella maioricensis]MCL9682612.1 inverse autotransporter beta domain-containing protein [Legionella maioricensis]MCL9686141.1 inverse autotransporter beta domain-containing protein [Legionella maioricensis]
MSCLATKLSFLSLSILLASAAVHAEFNPVRLPFVPRVSGEGFVGNRTIGEADAMLPLYGNQDSIFHVDGLGKIGGDNGSLGSIGGGYRSIPGNYLWGAYVFADFNRIAEGSRFFVLNPGLEYMTNRWDVHLNGYFPTSKQKVQGTFIGSEVGITQYVSFAGHNQFDNLVNLVDEVGNGLDGEVGFTLPETRNIRLFTGGYHFSFQQAQDINGVIGGVELPLNKHFTVSVRDSYDRVQKNTTLFTVRFTMGGVEKSEQADIHNRLLDPIPRHLGTWDTGSGIPSQQAFINTGIPVLTRDNIWFFSSIGSPFVAANGFSNCTFENNCLDTSFNQPTVDAINGFSPNANFYLGNGTYANLTGMPFAPHLAFVPASNLNLNEGQAVYGRSSDFTSGFLRDIKGSLILTGNNTFDFVRVLNDEGHNPVGLVISGSNIKITNSTVGGNSTSQKFQSAVNIEGASNVTIQNSLLNAFLDNSDPFDTNSTGVLIQNSTNINLINNNIIVDATQRTANSLSAQGIIADRADVVVTNSTVSVNALNTSNGSNVTTMAQGILISAQGAIELSSSIVNVTANASGGTNSTILAQGIFNNDARNMRLVENDISVNAINNNGLNNTILGRGYLISGPGGVTLLSNFKVNAASTDGENNQIIAEGVIVNNANPLFLRSPISVHASQQGDINSTTTEIEFSN